MLIGIHRSTYSISTNPGSAIMKHTTYSIIASLAALKLLYAAVPAAEVSNPWS